MDNVVSEFETRVGARAAKQGLKVYEQALTAFEAHRYAEARILLTPLAKEFGDVPAIHDLLGLALYREEKWAKAIKELEQMRRLDPNNVHNHAVLADCYRALGQHEEVETLWEELAEASPTAEVVAEGRIVLAGSLIDRGELDKALSVMSKADVPRRKVQEHHLRMLYVLADIHDRRGDLVNARRVFTSIIDRDPDFADVAERLSVLGD